MQSRKTLVLVAVLLNPIGIALAAEGDVETLLVTGTRLASTSSGVPGHVTVIDRSDIEARQARSALELLRSVAGVQVTQYGGRAGITSVFLRGAEPNFTVVLIDGVQVNDPNNTRGGSFDFSTLNIAEIERIEIIRGAQSSVYGSDALAGVIHIITRSPSEGASSMVEAEVGEEGFYRTAVHLNSRLGDSTRFGVTASTADDGEQLDGNDFENQAFDARLSGAPSQAVSFDFSARYADSESRAFPEDSGGPELAVLRERDHRDQTQWSLAGRAGYAATEQLAVNLQAAYVDHEETALSPGIAPGVLDAVPPTRSHSDLERGNVGINVAARLTEAVDAVLGVDYEEERGTLDGEVELFPGFSLPTDFQLDRDIVGLFAELRAQPGERFSASGSLRRDDASGRGAQTTSRVGAQYLMGNARVFANWSEGFKLPSFFALGHALVGNPDLEPETSRGWEAGLAGSLLDGRLDATVAVFDTRYRDLIDFDFDLFTNVNRSRVDTSGAELALKLAATDALRLHGHATYLDIDVKDGGATLRQRPQWRGGLSATWDVTPVVALTADWLYLGDSFDSSVPTGPLDLDGYHRLDVAANWRVSESLRLWLAVDNVLDEGYEETIGFPALDRRWRAGVRWLM